MKNMQPIAYYENCQKCDGECIGSTSCGGEGHAVCRACGPNGCLLTIDDYYNLPDECKAKRKEAAERIEEMEKRLFGPDEPLHIDLGNDTAAYRICIGVSINVLNDLIDDAIPHKLDIESFEYCRLEVNKTDMPKVDKILAKYD